MIDIQNKEDKMKISGLSGDLWKIEHYEVPPGASIYKVSSLGVEIAKDHGSIVCFRFNGVDVRISPYTNSEDVVSEYYDKLKK